MATSIGKIVGWPMAALALMSSAACSKGEVSWKVAEGFRLTSNQYESVCGGAAIPTARAYDKNAKNHRAVYYEISNGTTRPDEKTDQLPPDWSAYADKEVDPKLVDLVVCAQATSERVAKTCEGYKDNSGGSKTLILHNVTYVASIRAANTGKILTRKTIEATNGDCPDSEMFNSGSDSWNNYASLSKVDLDSLIKPILTP